MSNANSYRSSMHSSLWSSPCMSSFYLLSTHCCFVSAYLQQLLMLCPMLSWCVIGEVVIVDLQWLPTVKKLQLQPRMRTSDAADFQSTTVLYNLELQKHADWQCHGCYLSFKEVATSILSTVQYTLVRCNPRFRKSKGMTTLQVSCMLSCSSKEHNHNVSLMKGHADLPAM